MLLTPPLLLSQVDGAGLGSNGNPVLVQRFDDDLSHVFVVRVKVEDVSHHVGQTLLGEFLWYRRRWRRAGREPGREEEVVKEEKGRNDREIRKGRERRGCQVGWEIGEKAEKMERRGPKKERTLT